MRLPNKACEEEMYRVPIMDPMYMPRSHSSASSVTENVPRPIPSEEVRPKQQAPTDVPRPTPRPEVWPNQQAPTEVPRPTPPQEVRPDQPAPTVVPVASAAAMNIVVSVNPSVAQSRLTNVSWDTAINPMREFQPRAPRYMSQSRKYADRRGCESFACH
ncbi:BCL-6 corepressor-like protein 1 [Hyla sarda]|uniref:BCL-6 corepressor-like protein 1 n=1 Tax=Hyla sarda TaxID=327740 RepID=UPI0024C225B1|nr:BCL-6 corepressor-like protein 1 [Hyla sarda]